MMGRTISHYAIQEPLGEGGMGIVYRAIDQRLNRSVAIKVLRPNAFSDGERHSRFVKEARAASALNHPNIVTIYEIDTTDEGAGFIVMEYVDGKTLDAYIGRKGMRVSEVLKYAVQIAGALAAAHDAGIVHRDLKPGNIMISDKGIVKLLDFGLAKLSEPKDAAEAVATETLGMVPPHTEPGVVMGTVAYMSPEQAQGLQVDARSDIFAFGAVVYEMLTGRRAFQGANRMSTMTALLRDDPAALADLAEAVPPELERAIRRCLRKDRDKRVQHMSDLKLLLEELKEDSESGRLTSAGVVRPARRSRWRIAGISTACVCLGVALSWLFLRKPAAQPLQGMDLTADAGYSGMAALSADGKLLAFASDREGNGHINIWVKQVPGGEPVQITRERLALAPEFSPDGTRIYFESPLGPGIYVVPSLGGTPRRIVSNGQLPRISPDGTRLAYIARDSVAASEQLFVVNSGGGQAEQVGTKLRRVDRVLWSPDGTRLLASSTLVQYREDQTIIDWRVIHLKSGKMESTDARAHLRKFGIQFATPFVWREKAILFAGRQDNRRSIWLLPVDSDGRPAGAPSRLTTSTQDEDGPTWSASGLIAYEGLNSAYVNIWMAPLDADGARVNGELQRVTRTGAYNGNPSVTPDGRWVAFQSSRSGMRDLWLKDLSTGKELQLTNTPGAEGRPALAPDGTRVAYAFPEGTSWLLAVDSASPELLCQNCGDARGWFPDGRRLVFNLAPRTDRSAVGVFDMVSRKLRVMLQHPQFACGRARISQDGRWVAFEMAPSPNARQVMIAPAGEDAVPVSDWITVTEGTTMENKPEWSPNGRYVYYISDRDGFRCVWARSFDARTRTVHGEPVGVLHMHTSEKSMLSENAGSFDLAVARDKLLFNAGEVTANIHALKLP